MIKQILSEDEIERILTRMCSEILEKNSDFSGIMFIGVKNRGDILAKRLAKKIEYAEGVTIPTSAVDITFYRDDVHLKAYKYIGKNDIQFDVTDKDVILVDDVIYTGRSIRAAIDVLIDSGRPKSIQLVVLVDRGKRDLPIQPDYLGREICASQDSEVSVHLKEIDGEDKAILSFK